MKELKRFIEDLFKDMKVSCVCSMIGDDPADFTIYGPGGDVISICGDTLDDLVYSCNDVIGEFGRNLVFKIASGMEIDKEEAYRKATMMKIVHDRIEAASFRLDDAIAETTRSFLKNEIELKGAKCLVEENP